MAESLTETEMRQFWNAEDHIEGIGINWSPIFRVVESIVASRVRAARAQELRDAATAWNQGQWARHYAIPKQSEPAVERWLRDRANHIESSQNG